MKYGNWIPIDKAGVYYLPHHRPYTILEALFAYTVDLDNGKKGSINGYAKQWTWNRKKVRKFIKELGTDKGHIGDIRGTQEGHPITLKNGSLQGIRDKRGTNKGQKRDRKGDTTIYPNPNPEPDTNTYSQASNEVQLSELLFSYILKRDEKAKEPNYQTWALHIDRLVRIDSRTPEEIKEVIKWCQADSFWQTNILSTQKLREKFSTLKQKQGVPSVKAGSRPNEEHLAELYRKEQEDG